MTWKSVLDVPLTWRFIDCECGTERQVLTTCPDCGKTTTHGDPNVENRRARFASLSKLIKKQATQGEPVELSILMSRFWHMFEEAHGAMEDAPTDDKALDQLREAFDAYRSLQADSAVTLRHPSYADWWMHWDSLMGRTQGAFLLYLQLVTASTPEEASDAGLRYENAFEAIDKEVGGLKTWFERILVTSPRAAEELVAAWMKTAGFEGVVLTPLTSDGGVDVRSREAVAQVKATGRPVGRPDVQRLHGVAVAESRQAVFFSLAAYTPQAEQWATRVGMALLTFDRQGQIRGVNALGHRMAKLAPDWEPLQLAQTHGLVGPMVDVVGLVVGVLASLVGFIFANWTVGIFGLVTLVIFIVRLVRPEEKG